MYWKSITTKLRWMKIFQLQKKKVMQLLQEDFWKILKSFLEKQFSEIYFCFLVFPWFRDSVGVAMLWLSSHPNALNMISKYRLHLQRQDEILGRGEISLLQWEWCLNTETAQNLVSSLQMKTVNVMFKSTWLKEDKALRKRNHENT